MNTKAFLPCGGGLNLILGIGREKQWIFVRTPATVKFSPDLQKIHACIIGTKNKTNGTPTLPHPPYPSPPRNLTTTTQPNATTTTPITIYPLTPSPPPHYPTTTHSTYLTTPHPPTPTHHHPTHSPQYHHPTHPNTHHPQPSPTNHHPPTQKPSHPRTLQPPTMEKKWGLFAWYFMGSST